MDTKTISWIIPDVIKGSGGHRTIFQNIKSLEEKNYKCILYINSKKTIEQIKQEIYEWYNFLFENVYIFDKQNIVGDLVVATAWETAHEIADLGDIKKIYFIQDYEPWFFPMGENYINAKRTYSHEFRGITIGRWLKDFLKKEHDMESNYFDFCADSSIYKKDVNIKKEYAICVNYQPNKPRRCGEMAIEALKIVKKLNPDLKIYLYGYEKIPIPSLECEQLGVISVEECNELYNKCLVGVSFSATNPSRVPFEMMSAGLPVVELYLENNLYDFPDDGCLLCELSPEGVAQGIKTIIDNPNLLEEMSENGIKYMSKRNLQYGYNQFAHIIDNCLKDKTENERRAIKQYKKKVIKPTDEIIKTYEIIKKIEATKPEEIMIDDEEPDIEEADIPIDPNADLSTVQIVKRDLATINERIKNKSKKICSKMIGKNQHEE